MIALSSLLIISSVNASEDSYQQRWYHIYDTNHVNINIGYATYYNITVKVEDCSGDIYIKMNSYYEAICTNTSVCNFYHVSIDTDPFVSIVINDAMIGTKCTYVIETSTITQTFLEQYANAYFYTVVCPIIIVCIIACISCILCIPINYIKKINAAVNQVPFGGDKMSI
jgi:hypothetical protein